MAFEDVLVDSIVRASGHADRILAGTITPSNRMSPGDMDLALRSSGGDGAPGMPGAMRPPIVSDYRLHRDYDKADERKRQGDDEAAFLDAQDPADPAGQA